jgi:flagellar biosynthesis protein FliP
MQIEGKEMSIWAGSYNLNKVYIRELRLFTLFALFSLLSSLLILLTTFFLRFLNLAISFLRASKEPITLPLK